jgi:alanine racemase
MTTPLPNGNLGKMAPGDEIVLIGIQGDETITAYDLRKWAGTSSYKVLLSLNPVLPRKILS